MLSEIKQSPEMEAYNDLLTRAGSCDFGEAKKVIAATLPGGLNDVESTLIDEMFDNANTYLKIMSGQGGDRDSITSKSLEIARRVVAEDGPVHQGIGKMTSTLILVAGFFSERQAQLQPKSTF